MDEDQNARTDRSKEPVEQPGSQPAELDEQDLEQASGGMDVFPPPDPDPEPFGVVT